MHLTTINENLADEIILYVTENLINTFLLNLDLQSKFNQ